MITPPITRNQRKYLVENALNDSICWPEWCKNYEAALAAAEAENEKLRNFLVRIAKETSFKNATEAADWFQTMAREALR